MHSTRFETSRGSAVVFTGKNDPENPVVAAEDAVRSIADPANVSARRPHVPHVLAAARARAAELAGAKQCTSATTTHAVHPMRQVHGSRVARITEAAPMGWEPQGVDGLVTDVVGRTLAVTVADCCPVILAADDGPVGVAHAGRTGADAGVVRKTVAALRTLTSAPISAWIGPCIRAASYEVSEELMDDVASRHPHAAAATDKGTPALDVVRMVRYDLDHAGVTDVTDIALDTYTDTRWFSHRVDGDKAGRGWGMVTCL